MPQPVQFRAVVALITVLVCAACTTPVQRAAPPALPDPVLLISIDALHPDQIDSDRMPVLHALAESGVRARWMNPSYPTLTFPNHYTLVTGLRPDRHGIVDNTMWDDELGRFFTRDRESVQKPGWWGGEPIWNTAGRAGLRTATMFWVGSEAEIGGRRPDDWQNFSPAVSIEQRLATVLGWFERSPSEWPRLATLYFEHVDVAGHDFGPDSEGQRRAMSEIDAALGRLIDGLAERGLGGRINLLVVSDHGMAEASPERVVFLEDLVDGSAFRLIAAGEVAGLEPQPGREAELEAALLGRHGVLECWRKQELPPEWRYGTHPRIAAIVCQVDEGWKVMSRPVFARWGSQVRPGSHGYRPELPSMRATFIANGPAFRTGSVIEPFDNVDVYSLMTHLLGIEAAPNDGSIDALRPALVE